MGDEGDGGRNSTLDRAFPGGHPGTAGNHGVWGAMEQKTWLRALVTGYPLRNFDCGTGRVTDSLPGFALFGMSRTWSF